MPTVRLRTMSQHNTTYDNGSGSNISICNDRGQGGRQGDRRNKVKRKQGQYYVLTKLMKIFVAFYSHCFAHLWTFSWVNKFTRVYIFLYEWSILILKLPCCCSVVVHVHKVLKSNYFPHSLTNNLHATYLWEYLLSIPYVVAPPSRSLYCYSVSHVSDLNVSITSTTTLKD